MSKPSVSVLLLIISTSALHAAVTLAEIDFSGTGGSAVGNIGSSNGQFTIKNSAINFTGVTLNSVGGTSSTASWVVDSTGTAAANTDLFTSASFGSPTRLDLTLGLASVGQTYTISSVEIDIRAATTSASWVFGYRKASDSSTPLVGTQTITPQSGTDPITTYTIDLTAQGLTATDSATSWVTGGTGGLRWAFFEPTATGNDNFQVAAIRVIGTVVPEPSSAILLGSLAALGLVKRRR